MTTQNDDAKKNVKKAPGHVHPAAVKEANNQQNKAQAEQQEVAGKHKNDGQKAHKGAR
jgi:hypothetical protein